MSLMDELAAMRTEAEKKLREAVDSEALEAVRIAFLGRSGQLKNLMTRIKEVAAAEKK